MICLECKEKFESLKGLHIHLKVHGGQKEYYERAFQRKDLLCGAKVEYLSYDQYFSTFFVSKETRNSFYKSRSKAEVQKVILEEFKSHKNTKGLKCFPSSTFFDLADLFSVKDIKNAFGTIANFCKEANISQHFTKELPKGFWVEDTSRVNILVDTREQKPFNFKNGEAQKLSIGDYIAVGEHFSKIAIDRKSTNDYLISFGRDIERIKTNINTAKEMGYKLYYIIEGLPCQMRAEEARYKRDSKLKFVFHNTREILEEFYDTTQIIFCYNRIKAQDLTQRILFFGEEIFNCDIQFFNS